MSCPTWDTWYYDSGQQIFDEWLLPICRCACAHLSVKFSFLSQNILPSWLLFYNPTSHMRLLSVFKLSKRLCWSSTNFCTSRFPECPQQLCPCPPFLTHEPTFLSHPPAPNRVWQGTECSVLCWVDCTRFLNKNSRPRDHFFPQIII